MVEGRSWKWFGGREDVEVSRLIKELIFVCSSGVRRIMPTRVN